MGGSKSAPKPAPVAIKPPVAPKPVVKEEKEGGSKARQRKYGAQGRLATALSESGALG